MDLSADVHACLAGARSPVFRVQRTNDLKPGAAIRSISWRDASKDLGDTHVLDAVRCQRRKRGHTRVVDG